MDEQIPQQNIAESAPTGLTALQKDLIISASVGLLCALLILPIAQNLKMKPGLALSLLVVLPVLAAVGMRAAYSLAKKIKIFYQLAKFVLVGSLNTFVDWGILNLLMFLASISAGSLYAVFKGISFLIATTNSYFWNKFWTFKKISAAGIATSQPPQENAKEWLQFFIVSLVGFSLNVGMATFLVNVLGPQFGLSAKLWANVGAFGGTVLGMSWNFLGYKLVVFKS